MRDQNSLVNVLEHEGARAKGGKNCNHENGSKQGFGATFEGDKSQSMFWQTASEIFGDVDRGTWGSSSATYDVWWKLHEVGTENEISGIIISPI